MRNLAALVLLVSAWSANAAEFSLDRRNGTPMYDAPSVRAKKLFVASRQYPVEVVISIDSWVKVRDQAGDLVWVEKKTLSEKRTVIVTVPVADVKQAANDQAPLVFPGAAGRRSRCRGAAGGRLGQGAPREGQSGYVKINQVWGILAEHRDSRRRAWGTALAISLAGRHRVRLWARDAALASAIGSSRRNPRYLPKFRFRDRSR